MAFLKRTTCAAAVFATLQISIFAQQAPSSTAPDQIHPPTVQEQDQVLGAWVLDLSRSKFDPGPAPREEVRSYQQEHEGIKAEILTTTAEGAQNRIEYIASYNDVVALVTGSKQVDAIRMRRVDAYTAEVRLLLNGQDVGRARRLISRDGKTMTITYDRDAPTPVHNVEVYSKQP